MTWSFSRGETRIAPVAALGLLSLLLAPLVIYCRQLFAYEAMHGLYELGKAAKVWQVSEPIFQLAIACRSLDVSRDVLYAKVAVRLGWSFSEYHTDHDKDAERLMKEALDINRRVYGNSNLETAYASDSLGDFYLNRSRLQEAASLGEESLHIRKIVLGEKAPRTLLDMFWLASIYEKQNRLSETVPLMKTVYEADKNQYGENSWMTECDRYKLGKLYEALNRYDDAAQLLETALESQRKLPPRGFARANLAADLGLLYERSGKPDKAAESYIEALDAYSKAPGGELNALGMAYNAGSVLSRQHRHKEADQLFKKAIHTAESTYENRADMLILLEQGIGLSYKAQKLYSAAELHLLKAIHIDYLVLTSTKNESFQSPDRNIPGKVVAINTLPNSTSALAEIYRLTGRKQEATELEQRTALVLSQTK